MAYKSKYTGKQVDEGLDLAFNSQERIDTAIRNLVNGAPETLDTLKEVAEYIASDESRAADILQSLANLAKKDEELQTALGEEVASSEQMYEDLLSSITTATNAMRSSTPVFDRVVTGDVTLTMGSATTNYTVVYLEDKKRFAALNAGKYWQNWEAWGKYPSVVSYGPAPAVGKIYIMGKALYVWSGSSLNEIGDFDDIKKSIEHNTGAIANNVQAIDLLAEGLETKAPKVGYAPDLKVNFAKELVGRGVAKPQEIGTIRPTGLISIGDGNATIEKVKGKSVVWNQLYKTNAATQTIGGITFTREGENWRVNGVAENDVNFDLNSSGLPIIVGHTYVSLGSTNKVLFRDAWWSHFGSDGVFVCKKGDKWRPSLRVLAGTEVRNELITPRLIDLTQMFLAGNEPTTIEEFYARKPLGVSNEYNEGEIISYDAQELKSVGFNAWDEEWEVGGLANGEPSNTNSQIRSKNFTPCVGGQDYYGYMGWSSENFLHLAFYDANKQFIENRGCNRNVVESPDNAAYFKVYTTHECGYGNVYKGDICINLSHSGYRNGEYVPYEDDIWRLPDVKSIKDKDGNQLFPYGLLSAGNVYDEITATKAVKRVGVVDMGTLTWFTQSTTNGQTRFLADVIGIKRPLQSSVMGNVLTPKYQTLTADKVYLENVGISVDIEKYKAISLYDPAYTDVTTFMQAMQGVMLYYELAEPIEVDLPEPLNLTYDAWDFGTEEVIAEGATTPLNADIVYQFNAVDRIRENTEKNKKLEKEFAELKAQLTQLTQVSNENSNA